MARSSHRTPAAAPAQPAVQARAAVLGPLAMPMEAARMAMTHTLATAGSMVAWMGRMQQLQLQSYAALSRTLESASREMEGAGDPQALMAATAKLVNQQLALAMQQTGAAFSQWVETDLELVERMGSEVAALAQQTLPAPVRPGNGEDGSALKELGRLQDQWLALTQRWIDEAGARVPH